MTRPHAPVTPAAVAAVTVLVALASFGLGVLILLCVPLCTVLALRDDYTAAGCWALESAERVCRKPEGDEPHLTEAS